MKQALSPETPARVRRNQFRAITLGIGASAFAMACSFGAIDDNGKSNGFPDVTPPSTATNQPAADGTSTPAATGPTTTSPVSNPGGGSASNTGTQTPAAPYNPDADPFTTEIGKQVKAILTTNCAGCHQAPSTNGDINYMLDAKALIDNQKIIPGNKEDSRIYSRMVGGQMPPAYIRDIRPSFSDIDIVGQWIDEMQPLASELCDAPAFVDNDKLIREMQQDVSALDGSDQPFIRYLTVAYSANGGGCGRELDRQRYALYKTINSVSTNPVIQALQPIDPDKLIYRIDIRDFNWDRPIDLKDDGTILFNDGWDAIVDAVGDFAVEYVGPQADSLKQDTGTAVPFLAVNAFIQQVEQGDLYYSLIGGKHNLFDFEKQVLKIDTAAEIAENNVMRGGFTSSGVSKQDRVLNRFDSGIGPGTNYWLSFDFNGGNGNGQENVANESIFRDPLGFKFAGGEAIFSLPNGLQGYYVAVADGSRLNEAPIGVVVDPSQNNGNVINGASCNSCHNAGMISFQDQVRQYVEDHRTEYDNQTYQDVMDDYPAFADFQKAMDSDSKMHTDALERAGLPPKFPDPVSRVFADFQLGNLTLAYAAGELGVTPDVLLKELPRLSPTLQQLGEKGGYVDRNTFTTAFLASICDLQAVNQNQPTNCP